MGERQALQVIEGVEQLMLDLTTKQGRICRTSSKHCGHTLHVTLAGQHVPVDVDAERYRWEKWPEGPTKAFYRVIPNEVSGGRHT